MSFDDDSHDDGNDSFAFARRRFLQGAASVSLLGGTAAGQSSYRTDGTEGDGGDGRGGGGDGHGGDGFDDDANRLSITLVTGQTLHVTEIGDELEIAVDADDESFHVVEGDDTYVFPADADLELYSEELFNVDFLVEQGLSDAETDGVPVILGLANDAASTREAGTIRAAEGFTAGRTLESIGGVSGRIHKAEASVASATFLENDSVERVYLDANYEALLDTSAGAIDAPAARDDFDVDGSGVTIAVVDTGIDADHPDFGDRVVHEADFSGDGTDDANGHGTHVAGIAAGDGTESGGEYVGVAPGADLMNVSVLGDDGSGSISDIVAGIEHAVDEGADIVSMSLGGPIVEDDPMAMAVDDAASEGVVVTVSAGNSYGHDSITSPGQAEGAITVGATDDATGAIADFSSGGPTPIDYRIKPDVVAPGVDVTASGSDDAGEFPYADKSGTSMAAPHVAGVSALLLEHDGDRDPDDVRDALVATANPLENDDVFLQGGGQVDASAALDPDLAVHDPVLNFGIYDEETTDSGQLTLENVGGDLLEIDVDASLENVQSGESRDDTVSVTPSSLSLESGETDTLDVEIDTSDAFGWNSGVVTLETDAGATYNAIFGFTRGIGVTIEKLPHEESGSIADDGLWIFSDDGEINRTPTDPFANDETYTATLFTDEATLNVWSWGELEDRADDEYAITIEEGVDLEDTSHVVLDEREVVPRTLDTAAIEQQEPFHTHQYRVETYAPLEGIGLSYGFLGGFHDGIPTVHYSPVDESDHTNVGTEYLFESAAAGDSAASIGAPEVFHLYYPTVRVDSPADVLEVDPDRLAREEFTYHRSDDQSYGLSPFLAPVDDETFPTVRFVTLSQSIGDEADEQTWYRSPAVGEYRESWSYGSIQVDRSEQWEPDRVGFVPDPGETYRATLERDPILPMLFWDVTDDHLTLSGQWHTDQSPQQFVRTDFGAPFSDWNEAFVYVDGDLAASGLLPTFGFDFDTGIEPGTTVTVEMAGNAIEWGRDATTVATYEATHEPGVASEPPEIDRVDVAGLALENAVRAGQFVAFVDVDDPSGSGVELEAYHAASGTTDELPFDGGDGWTEAEVVYDDGPFGVLVDVAGQAGAVDLAIGAVDEAGNSVESASFEALSVVEGADASVPVDVRPDELDVGSNQRVPVLIEGTEDVDPDDVDVDTLRFGNPEAVHDGSGAKPIRHQRLGNGSLQVQFAARDAGYEEETSPAAATLVGELADGTRFSGVDVVLEVTR